MGISWDLAHVSLGGNYSLGFEMVGTQNEKIQKLGTRGLAPLFSVETSNFWRVEVRPQKMGPILTGNLHSTAVSLAAIFNYFWTLFIQVFQKPE